MAEDRIIKSAVGDIHMPGKKLPVDTSIEFDPQNPFTIDLGNALPVEQVGFPGTPIEDEPAGFFASAKSEFKQTSTDLAAIHAAQMNVPEKPDLMTQHLYPDVGEMGIYKAPAPGWTPKQEIENMSELDPRYLPVLLGARNEQDFQYRLDDLRSIDQDTKNLENGSTMGKIIGGLIGYSPIGSIENFIPFATIATKAKVGQGFLSNAIKMFPGMLGASAIREGAFEADKTDRSLPEFIKNTFVDAAFASVFFGGLGGAIKSSVNLAEFNKLKDFAKANLNGIGFIYKISEEGEVAGFKAVMMPGEALNAAKLTRAQEQADAAFYKGGLFKVPYLGTGALNLISGNVPGFEYIAGSPLVRLLTSKYPAAAAFANSAFDHFITTVNEATGGVREQSFESKVKQTRAQLTSLYTQMIALHAERNGYEITARPTIGIQNSWNAAKQKSIEALSRQTKSTDYVGKDQFMDEIQQVLHSEVSSEHASVNEAAAMYRKVIDDTYAEYRKAYNLPKDWLPPRTATAYLMRVYDTNYLTTSQGRRQWNEVVSGWLKESDEKIAAHMQPIKEVEEKLANAKASHEALVNSVNVTDKQIRDSQAAKDALRIQKEALENKLSNDLRNNPDLHIHVDDWTAFSADEAAEIKQITKRVDIATAEIKKQKQVISNIKAQAGKRKEQALKSKTINTAKSNMRKSDTGKLLLEKEEAHLAELENELYDEQLKIQERIANGEINQKYYFKEADAQTYKIKDPSNRLKFRDVHESDQARVVAAQAYLDSITNMRPEDIVADVFGRMTGKTSENVLKSRTLPVPDEILYQNNFMSKDLHAKTANYVNYLSKRTHLKTSFSNVTVNGDFNELAVDLLDQHKYAKGLIEDRIVKLEKEHATATGKKKEKLAKELKKENKNFKKEVISFEKTREDIKQLYENRMMGLNKKSDFDSMARRTWMSITAAANLHNLPATQITDLAFVGFQHGIWSFVRDGVYPVLNSMAGMLKTADSEGLRIMAGHLNLGCQDVLNHYADRNWSAELQPTINMGRFVSGVEKYSHFSAATDLSPYIDNGVQHIAGSVIQSRFMELLHKEVAGTLTEKESLYLRKYGIDPKVWAKRMVDSYKQSKGFQTKTGGYISKAWEWQDLEAANAFNTSVFRGIQNTLIWKGMADSPFLADNILGLFFHTFTGWGYAAANRYLIPSLQHPDGELVIKSLFMAGAGAMVSPTRRMARGEQPWPDDMTDSQIAYEAFTDSGLPSTMGNVLNTANFLTGDRLLGDLKNDKFRNRARTGIFGLSDVVSSTAVRISDVLGMANSGINEKDMKTAAHMLPITGSMYGHYVSDKIIEGFGLPRNKRAAQIK